MFKRKTLFSTLICSIALILLAIPCMISFNNAKHVDTPLLETRTTSVELSDQDIDYESVFNQFEDGKLETNETLTTFEGYQTLNLADLMELDNVSVENLEESELKVKYSFSYDSETNIVTLSATTDYENGETEEDYIYGAAFVNEQGNLDAVLDIDGEYVLLSELQDAGLIQNCGWFKKAFKKIVKAAVQVVVVAAVASVVAVSCGAGLGAVVAVGAVAGAIGGGIAGAKISYDETGEVQPEAVLAGVGIGAALGALTGLTVGKIAGAGTSVADDIANGADDAANVVDDFVENTDKISKNIDMDKISEHVFSNDHINNGIMELGNSKQDILTKFFDTAKANSSKWVEGSNEIRTIINGKETTIRFFVKNGEIVNLDGFVGTSSRVIGNLINLIK